MEKQSGFEDMGRLFMFAAKIFSITRIHSESALVRERVIDKNRKMNKCKLTGCLNPA
ncbi:MAG: hypothetical protein H0X43_10870 [Nitrosospira sp.]|nr:hypothetical protein [Nitrosospira sp.]